MTRAGKVDYPKPKRTVQGGKFNSTGGADDQAANRQLMIRMLAAVDHRGTATLNAQQLFFIEDVRTKLKGRGPMFGWRQIDAMEAIFKEVCGDGEAGASDGEVEAGAEAQDGSGEAE